MTEAHRDYPRLFPRPDQTIAGIGCALREGRISCVDILNQCLEQVDEWEPKVHAWVRLDRDGALEQARALDEELKAGNDRGSLHGIPIGIKDIFDVKGLPTACGAKRWVDRIAENDAEVVARLRTAGAVIMGKTVTTAYAWIDPPPTRNPWSLERTPGGSSSGSAAAVACGMCIGTIGTQTGGSITRPAAYCGVAGMKPSKLNPISMSQGFLPFAPSLDHVGPLARTVDDLRLLFEAMSDPEYLSLNPDRYSLEEGPVKLGRPRGFFDQRATPEVRSALDEAASVLVEQGADIFDFDDPVDFETILKDHRTLLTAEAANVHSVWLQEFAEDYPPLIRDIIQEGQNVLALDYFKAEDRKMEYWSALHKAACDTQRRFWITPAAPSTAPDRSTTGDPSFNAPWSYTGLPTVSFPIGKAPDGLPVAIQIVDWVGVGSKVLRVAEWCEQVIQTWRQ
jgi:aspartyl-tRNA(Asn)/glutamyl-tRNA(Gln) amidotransferase subunit A